MIVAAWGRWSRAVGVVGGIERWLKGEGGQGFRPSWGGVGTQSLQGFLLVNYKMK